MARSLVVKHEETAGTSSLLNAFLLVAVAWMVGGVLLTWDADAAVTPTVTVGE